MADARCAIHPERDAAATCVRCGSFTCAECIASDLPGHCRTCAERLNATRASRHVPLLGIVMMVHGGLVVALALYYIVFDVFMIYGLAREPTGDAQDPIAELMPGLLVWAFMLLGAAHLFAGVLQLYAGFRIRTFRSRGLALLALGAGLLTMLGCYCAPTSIGLAIWGLILLLNDDVAQRFAATRMEAS